MEKAVLEERTSTLGKVHEVDIELKEMTAKVASAKT